MNVIEKQTILEDLLLEQQSSLNHFFECLDVDALEKVRHLLCQCEGMVVLTGVGKSGLVAKKTAVTLTSTGTKAIFLSPTNALHGDIGILSEKDIFIVFSKSGESDELLNLIPFVRNRGVKVVAIVSNSESRLAKAVDVTIALPSVKELCPYDLAPTTSTTIQSIIGDILSVALMKEKNFSESDFAHHHPAGRLGKRLTVKVEDLMLTGGKIPICRPSDRLADTLVELTNKQCGCVLVIDDELQLLGVFTDGDLRRALQENGQNALTTTMDNLMSREPRVVMPDLLVVDALKLMESNQKSPITVLPVVSGEGRVVGLLKMHDIVQAGL